MARVGVEQSLSDIQEALQQQGHEVIQLQQQGDEEGCDCCVISGQDQNMMGMQDTQNQGSVINCHGMTADEVCQQVDQRVQQQ
ncbi:YkuS family protein [Bacillus sp. H-16]|uniref:YkuS family protein n=1 Tax=Alteribacter salitolerans TaxID=2912333 RepID=UPI001962A3FF|nr:YkuS family protein [Alteribacter salitolerans]MBM7095999.1 YkuS family protein [Alteribacter salitolerans]